RHRLGDSVRTPRPYLRSVLHHEGDRSRHRSGPFDFLRHRQRTRRCHPVRQHGRAGHALHVSAADRGAGSSPEQPAGVARLTKMPTTRSGTILVVDDEEIMREILETLLTREGYEVRLAASGAEGLELARAVPFDAAIVDIMMPGLDGIATLDEL